MNKFLPKSLGFLLLLNFLSLAADFQNLYSPDGLIDQAVLGLQQEKPYLGVSRLLALLQHGGLAPLQAAWLLAFSYVGLCVWLIFSKRPCIPAAYLLPLQISIFGIVNQFSYGMDYIATSLLCYCIILPKEESAYYGRYVKLIQIHLCLVYFFGGLDKLLGYNWWNGEALWKALNLPYFNLDMPIPLETLAKYPLLLQVGGWLVILLEMLYPLCIWLRPTKTIWLWAAVAMHLMIALVFNLYAFSLLMIFWNLAAFGQPGQMPMKPPRRLKKLLQINPNVQPEPLR